MDLTQISDDAFSLILSHLGTKDQIALRQSSSGLKEKVDRVVRLRVDRQAIIEEKGLIPTMRYWGPLHDRLKGMPEALRTLLWNAFQPRSMTLYRPMTGVTVAIDGREYRDTWVIDLAEVEGENAVRVLGRDRGVIGPVRGPYWYAYQRRVDGSYIGTPMEITPMANVVNWIGQLVGRNPCKKVDLRLPQEVLDRKLARGTDRHWENWQPDREGLGTAVFRAAEAAIHALLDRPNRRDKNIAIAAAAFGGLLLIGCGAFIVYKARANQLGGHSTWTR